MNTLRLEELESRHVLSGGFYAPQEHFGPRPMPFGQQPGPGQVMFADQMPAGNFGRIGGMEGAGPNQGMPFQSVANEEIVLEIVIIERMPVDAGGPDVPVATPASAGSAKPIVDTGSVTAESTAAHPTEATRTNSVTPIVLNPVVNAPLPALDVIGPVAAQSAVHPVRSSDLIMAPIPAWLSQLSGPAGNSTPISTEDNDSIEITPDAQPAAQPVLIAAAPVVDLVALGRGLQQFIGQLERAGEQLVGHGGGLRPWLVAAAAAATACEIARRQWVRGHTAYAGHPRSDVKLYDI